MNSSYRGDSKLCRLRKLLAFLAALQIECCDSVGPTMDVAYVVLAYLTRLYPGAVVAAHLSRGAGRDLAADAAAAASVLRAVDKELVAQVGFRLAVPSVSYQREGSGSPVQSEISLSHGLFQRAAARCGLTVSEAIASFDMEALHLVADV